MKKLLLVFAKNPVPGEAKTRLSADLGIAKAMEIYKFLLSHTAKVAAAVNADKEVHYADYINTADMWDDQVFRKRLQNGANLGQRMLHAIKAGFADGYESIVLIGTDCKDLQTDDLELAFRHLEKADAVIGPANDGGYYLIGLSKLNEKLFINKEWSTETVLSDSIMDLESAGFQYEVLDEKVDVDHAEDWED